jgi:putative acetyltransferase
MILSVFVDVTARRGEPTRRRRPSPRKSDEAGDSATSPVRNGTNSPHGCALRGSPGLWYQRAMHLRPATNADAEQARALVFGVLEEYGLRADPEGIDSDLDDLDASYAARGGLFDVLEEDGRVVGTVGLFPLRDGVCELRKMYLAREARGRGLGRRLLDHALERARELGFRRVELETSSKLVEAIALYRRYGFEPVDGCHQAARCDQSYALDLG